MELHGVWVWAEVSGLLRLLEQGKMKLLCGLLAWALDRWNASNISTERSGGLKLCTPAHFGCGPSLHSEDSWPSDTWTKQDYACWSFV